MNDVFGPGSNVERRFIQNYEELTKQIAACKALGLKIVATSGTYDLLHEGHCAYLEKAKLSADIDPSAVILVVGIDSDEKVVYRKKRNPIGNQEERMKTLCHIRHVDLVIIKHLIDPKFSFLRAVKPDVLVISQTNNFPETYKQEISELCGKVIELPPQATTSTTARIRKSLTGFRDPLEKKVDKIYVELKEVIDQIFGPRIPGGG